MEASGKLSQSPLFIDDTPSRTVTEIAACARRLKRKENLGLVVVDYLQLIQPDDPRDPRQEQVAKMARRLKALARELQIPIMVLAQLNRQVEASGREEHRPRLSHLRESGAIEQDADVVMFVHREEYYHTAEKAEEMGITGQGHVDPGQAAQRPDGRREAAMEFGLHAVQRFLRKTVRGIQQLRRGVLKVLRNQCLELRNTRLALLGTRNSAATARSFESAKKSVLRT